MSIPRKQTLYAIADRYNRTASIAGNSVVFNNTFTPLSNNPIGWDQVQIQFKTVQKYFSLNRDFTVPLTFVHDGARIIREKRYKGKGYAEELYLIILQWDAVPTSPTVGQYILEYKGRIDLSQGVSDDPLRGITVNTKASGAVSFLNSNDTVNYEINNDDTNPASIKVLFDGIPLFQKYNYGISNVPVSNFTTPIPVYFISNEGDDYGITHSSQSIEEIATQPDYYANSSNYFFKSAAPITINLKGRVGIKSETGSGNSFFAIYFKTSLGAEYTVAPLSTITIGDKRFYNFDITISLVGEEKLYFILNTPVNGRYTLDANNFTISFSSKKPATTAYGLRQIDLWKQLVSKMTSGRFSGDSNFLTIHNNIIAISGEGIRNLPEAKFKTNVSDFFQSVNALAYQDANGNVIPTGGFGIKIVNDVIWLEPKADLYNDSTQIFDLGEVSDFKITDANEYFVNVIKTGGPVQDYQNMNNTNGRYEFNGTFEWLMPGCDFKKEYNLVSKYRIDGYGMEFVRSFFEGKDTSDSKSDNEVFSVNISNTKGVISTLYNTSRLITVNPSPTLPVFLTAYGNSIINNNKPTVKGFATANTKVGILTDGVQDGFTTSDQYGFWIYDIQTTLQSYQVDGAGTVIHTGIHTIGAAYTDSSGVIPIASLSTDISVTINTTVQSPLLITSPESGEYLFNNRPIIKGIAPAGSVISVVLDGVQIGTATADGSCMWQVQVTTPILLDGIHTITASYGPNSTTISFNLSYTTLAFPLVTYVNGHTEQTIYTRQPFIEGVATPNTTFLLYFDYGLTGPVIDPITGLPQNFAIAPQSVASDANGYWSYQVTTDIPDGDHEISSTSVNQQVFINVEGYTLKRGTYTINNGTLKGVPTDSVFNVEEITPHRALLAHAPYLRALGFQQPIEKITYQTSDKNKNLSTTQNGITITEKKDVQISSLAGPLFLPYFFEFKTKVPLTFAQIMSNLEAGDIKFSVNGVVLYGLPIGELTVKPVNQEAQTWKLLASPKNSLQTLLNLSL